MLKSIYEYAIKGAWEIYEKAKRLYEENVKLFGKEKPIGFPNTAYYLPVIYSILGYPVKCLGDCGEVLEEIEGLLKRVQGSNFYWAFALDAGMATFFAEEIIEAIKYFRDPDFYVKEEEPVENKIWLGAADDVVFRKRGVEFVDGTAPGFAIVLGIPSDKEAGKTIIKDLQEKNLYVFMHGEEEEKSFPQILREDGFQLGWGTRLVPFGPEASSIVFSVGFACRVAMSFGGLKPGQAFEILSYARNRIFAFVLAFGSVSKEWAANVFGAFNFGCPVILESDLPEIKVPGLCLYEHLVSGVPLKNMVEKALEVRGLKITSVKLDIPVSYAAAFEGERVRKEDLYIEFGGGRTPAVELLISKDLEEVEDGKIEVIGPEIENLKDIDPEGPPYRMPLGLLVEVAGANMQTDFEPIVERQIHYFLNYAQGIMHVGQRNLIWIRIGKQAVEKGFRLRHLGTILYARIKEKFGTFIDKVQVKIFTEEERVRELMEKAKEVYVRRDARLSGLVDEEVEMFYSCTLCQSFAPSHVCIITPERVGMCGAYNWLDARAGYELNPTGPNQPVYKGKCLDPVYGYFEGVNTFVKTASKGNVERMALYSILKDPMTACGCFECIAAVLPKVNGIMIVNRDFTGLTPTGMKFTTMAGMIGGGLQIPGFLGVSKHYITSAKFLQAEGGLKRVVWMPKVLKEELSEKLRQRVSELGIPDLLEKIADETVASTEDELMKWVKRVGHPVGKMPPLL